MSKKKNILIPKLRFPEFVDCGEWKKKELDKLLDYEQPTAYLVNSTLYDDTYQTAVLTAGKTFVLGYTNESEGIFKNNLPVIIFDDFTTASKFVDFSFKVKSSAMKILLAKNEANIKFVFEAMQMIKFEVGVHKRNWISVFSQLKIPVPQPKEQQKIASCLSSLDEVIEAHSKKLQLLKDHKKGLLQNLFPQEGEKVPKLRFPEFENSGEWEKIQLKKICKYQNGKAHEKDIDEKGNYIVVNSKFISTDGEVVKFSNSAFCLAKEGDILMVLSDVPKGKAIAKCFYVIENNKYTVNQRICRITPKNISDVLLFYILNRNSYYLKFDDGVKQTNLKKEDVLNCPIFVPQTLDEQQKTASCLSALDNLITAQVEKIEQLQQHKKGLMQGLFPKMDS